MSGAKENLGSPVPESNNLVSITLERNGEGAAKSQISDLEDAFVLVKQEILRLEVPMKNTVAMAVSNPLAELVKEALDERRRKGPRIGALAVGIDKLLEIGVEILEDEVEVGLGTAILVGVDVLDAEEADDVEGLREHLEEGDLTESGGRDAFLVHFEPGLLEGDKLAAGLVFGLVDLAVCAFTDLLKLLVLVHGGIGV